MKIMSSNFFEKYKKGRLVIEAQSAMPERFVNLLWNNGVNVKNIKRKSITTLEFEITLKDFLVTEQISRKSETKIKILNRLGTSFFIIKMKKRSALFIGFIVFCGLLFYLSTYIWVIDITPDKYVSPFEIRKELYSYGIKPGIRKSEIVVSELEKKISKQNDNIMWSKIRMEGSKLIVTIVERQSPPVVIIDDAPCNMVAKADAQIIRVYTTAGTSLIKSGDIVKKGQILIKNTQGKEGSEYLVHAKGDVIGRTFYEEKQSFKFMGTTTEKTGKKSEDIYINLFNKQIYFKKYMNKFQKYDKMIDSKGIIKKNIYYEIKDVPINVDINKKVDEITKELYLKITGNFDKTILVKDTIVNYNLVGENCDVKVLVVAEENIAKIEER